MNNKKLEKLFFYQFTTGCDRIQCHNVHCRNCPNFKLKNLKRDEIIAKSKLYAQTDSLHKRLCRNLPATVAIPGTMERLNEFNSWAKQIVINENDPIDFPAAIHAINGISEIFPFALLTNSRPLSLKNHGIDEEFIIKFANKLSSHPELSAAMTSLVFSNVEILDHLGMNFFSTVRIFVLLFAFPQIFDANVIDDVLEHLVNFLAEQSVNSKTSVALNYFKKNPKLLSAAVSACHFSISYFFSNNITSPPHTKHVFKVCKALCFLYNTNIYSTARHQASLFYNYHINQRIKIETEIKMDPTKSFLQFPFVLSLQTKYELCKSQSTEIMNALAISSFVPGVAMSLRPQGTTRIEPFFTVHVRRDHLLEDTQGQIMAQNPLSYLKMLKVVFEGESAVDVGGPSREFLYLISEQLFSLDFGMFVHICNDRYLWFSMNSFEDASSYQLVGIIVGLAVYNSILLPIRFPRVLYKKVLFPNRPMTLLDFSEVDEEAANSLRHVAFMKANGDDISDLELTFDITQEVFGLIKTFPLKKGMSGVRVTNQNLDEYIQSYLDFVLVSSIRRQFDYFSKGFRLVCRAPVYSMLDPSELAILVSGEEVLDWVALKTNCFHTEGYSKDSRAVKWFWEIFEEDFSSEEKKMFLKFVTGTDQSPLGGLGNVKLVLQKSEMVDRLPVAHTCFNMLALPNYDSKEVMRDRLKLAIRYTEGFGMV